ncbi:hypothetical protein AAG570_000259 [Ranatra chinensis]|uniref:DUF4772 domain-containing protein n=1 Tax=Ranatra chinensis TaxID=642074 RepID=A0ABD0YWK7_9HEMI
MSTGKRLAKRSIIGTRVCVRAEDGFYYPGVIDSVKTPADNPTAPPSQTRYTVRFDRPAGAGLNSKREFRHSELIGSGFGTIHGVRLLPAQKVYITYNGREISGRVVVHRVLPDDEVVVSVLPPGAEVSQLIIYRNSVSGVA